MSRVSISKSYAVLAGIEGYGKAKHTMRVLHDKVDHSKHKIEHSFHAAGNESGSGQVQKPTERHNEKNLPFHPKTSDSHLTQDGH